MLNWIGRRVQSRRFGRQEVAGYDDGLRTSSARLAGPPLGASHPKFKQVLLAAMTMVNHVTVDMFSLLWDNILITTTSSSSTATTTTLKGRHPWYAHRKDSSRDTTYHSTPLNSLPSTAFQTPQHSPVSPPGQSTVRHRQVNGVRRTKARLLQLYDPQRRTEINHQLPGTVSNPF